MTNREKFLALIEKFDWEIAARMYAAVGWVWGVGDETRVPDASDIRRSALWLAERVPNDDSDGVSGSGGIELVSVAGNCVLCVGPNAVHACDGSEMILWKAKKC